MRQSALFQPTLKEPPKDAESSSHKLLVKGGYIRQIAAGSFAYLPLGFRVLEKVKAIVFEELAKRGVQHLSLPNLHPAELWQESGRWEPLGKDVLFQLKNHQGRDLCLAVTHEEIVVDVVRQGISSYRQLPCILNQIQWKYRDELRPRGGLLRLREFLMQDAYSFCATEQQLDDSYTLMREAYKAIFARCGLDAVCVDADSGAMGGKFSHEFMVLADSGEDRIMTCTACDYKANIEKAITKLLPCNESEVERPMLEKNVQRELTVDAQAKYYQCSPWRILKSVLYRGDGKDVFGVMIRGDLGVSEKKLANLVPYNDIRMLTDEEITSLGTARGFISPVQGPTSIRWFADTSITTVKNFITGANKNEVDLIDVNPGRDFPLPALQDFAEVSVGLPCPLCATGELTETRGVEVGHIFKLGTRYTVPMNALFTNEKGEQEAILMGCFGIGIDRIVAGAVEQNHDDYGPLWPKNIAPFDLHLLVLDGGDTSLRDQATVLYDKFITAGVDVLFDDRDEKPGVKFATADLAGIPWRIVLSKKSLEKGGVEVKKRAEKDAEIVPLDTIFSWWNTVTAQ